MAKAEVDISNLTYQQVSELLRDEYGLLVELDSANFRKLYGGYSGSNYAVKLTSGVEVCTKVCNSYSAVEVEQMGIAMDTLYRGGFTNACRALPRVGGNLSLSSSSPPSSPETQQLRFASTLPGLPAPTLVLTFVAGEAADKLIARGGVSGSTVLKAVGNKLATLHAVPVNEDEDDEEEERRPERGTAGVTNSTTLPTATPISIRRYEEGGACQLGDHASGRFADLLQNAPHPEAASHPFVAFYLEQLGELQRCVNPAGGLPGACRLREGLIHGDLFLDNVLATTTATPPPPPPGAAGASNDDNDAVDGGAGVSGGGGDGDDGGGGLTSTGAVGLVGVSFVDFEDACVGPLLFDLAACLIGSCFTTASPSLKEATAATTTTATVDGDGGDVSKGQRYWGCAVSSSPGATGVSADGGDDDDAAAARPPQYLDMWRVQALLKGYYFGGCGGGGGGGGIEERRLLVPFMRSALLCNAAWRFKNFHVDHRELLLQGCGDKHAELEDRLKVLLNPLVQAEVERQAAAAAAVAGSGDGGVAGDGVADALSTTPATRTQAASHTPQRGFFSGKVWDDTEALCAAMLAGSTTARDGSGGGGAAVGGDCGPRRESFDAILVLGGGVPPSPTSLLPFVASRCDAAAAVWQAAAAAAAAAEPGAPGVPGEDPGGDDGGGDPGAGRSGNGGGDAENGGGGGRRRRRGRGREKLQLKPPALLCLSAGTAHAPQLVNPRTGQPVWESTASATYLIQAQQVPSSAVSVETSSYDTIGYAFFARTNHTDLAGWRRLLVVTSAFHMARTKAIFDWVFSLPLHDDDDDDDEDDDDDDDDEDHEDEDRDRGEWGGGESRQKTAKNAAAAGSGGSYELTYLATPDEGLSAQEVCARARREAASAETVAKVHSVRCRSLRSLHAWLTSSHDLYSAEGLVHRAAAAAEPSGAGDDSEEVLLLKSYGGRSTASAAAAAATAAVAAAAAYVVNGVVPGDSKSGGVVAAGGDDCGGNVGDGSAT